MGLIERNTLDTTKSDASARTIAFTNNADLLTVFMAAEKAVSSMQYNGVAMTQVDYNAYGDLRVYAFVLRGAAQGAYNLTYSVSAYSYERINIRAIAGANPVPVDSNSSAFTANANSHELTLTTTKNSLVYFLANWHILERGTGLYSTTELVDATVGNNADNMWFGRKTATTLSTTVGASHSTWVGAAYLAVAIKEQPPKRGIALMF